MAKFINAEELSHRICNGFISHGGYVDGEFKDIYVERGIDINDEDTTKVLNAVVDIITSVSEDRQYTMKIYHEEES